MAARVSWKFHVIDVSVCGSCRTVFGLLGHSTEGRSFLSLLRPLLHSVQAGGYER